MTTEYYFARNSQTIMGTPTLMLDITDIFARKGLEKGLGFYGNVDYVFAISESAIVQLYGNSNPALDSQLDKIQRQMMA